MTTNDDRLLDPFIDWLDASVAGTSTPGREAEGDPDLSDICTAARQFHGLDARLEQYAVTVSPRTKSWEDIMSAHPAALETLGMGARDRHASPPPSSVFTIVKIRTWERAANMLLVATLVLALAAGLWRAADHLGFGTRSQPPDDQPIPFGGVLPEGDGDTNALVPVATVPVDMETSSIPYPTADECTVEPMTREEVIRHFQLANIATESQGVYYEQAIVPSAEDAAAIMQTFREWQACFLDGRALAYSLQFETPWYTGQDSSLFYHNERPVTDEMIENWADIVLGAEAEIGGTPVDEPATPAPLPATPARLPLPENATPVAFPTGGAASPTIFAEDITIIGPDTAIAMAYFVDPLTREVFVTTPLTFEFVKVDGQWLINDSREGVGG